MSVYTADVLRRLLSVTGKSKTEMASEMGVSRAQLHRYLNGTSEPGYGSVVCFCEKNNLTILMLPSDQVMILNE